MENGKMETKNSTYQKDIPESNVILYVAGFINGRLTAISRSLVQQLFIVFRNIIRTIYSTRELVYVKNNNLHIIVLHFVVQQMYKRFS